MLLKKVAVIDPELAVKFRVALNMSATSPWSLPRPRLKQEGAISRRIHRHADVLPRSCRNVMVCPAAVHMLLCLMGVTIAPVTIPVRIA